MNKIFTSSSAVSARFRNIMNCKNLEKYSEFVYTLLTVYNCTVIPGKIKIVPGAVEAVS